MLLDRLNSFGGKFAVGTAEITGELVAGFSYRLSKLKDNSWGIWLLMIAPSVVEIAGGKNDGVTGFDFVDVDLLALPECLDEVESFSYDPDDGRDPHLTLTGKKGKREVVIEVSFEPFDDDETATIFDVNVGGWRDRRAEE